MFDVEMGEIVLQTISVVLKLYAEKNTLPFDNMM